MPTSSFELYSERACGNYRETYEDVAGFYSPDVCYQDARKYIPSLAERRGFDPTAGLSVLDEIGRIVEPVDRSLYEDNEKISRERVHPRDPEDWPVADLVSLWESYEARVERAA